MPALVAMRRAALLGGRKATGYTFANAEASALAARFDTPPTDARKQLIDNLIGSLKNGATSGTNIWAKIDVLYVMAAADSQAALLEWKGNTAYNAVSGGAAAFTADHGFLPTLSGDPLTTGYAPGTSSLGIASGNAHIGAFVTGTGVAGFADISFQATSYQIISRDTGGFGRIAGSTAIVAPVGANPQHIVVSRTSSTSAFAYRDGVAGSQMSTSSTTAFSSSLLLGGSVAGSPSGRTLNAAHVGVALNAAEALDFYNALNTYMVAVGAI